MNKIHNKLSQKFSWYENFHKSQSHTYINWMIFVAAAVVFTAVLILTSEADPFFSSANNRRSNLLPNEQYFKIADASDGEFGYGYAPSIVKAGNTLHVFFCSVGSGDLGSWDFVRYTKSTDNGKNWTDPRVMLKAKRTADGRNLAACDPSVVFYQGYYYMYYSSAYESAPETYQTVIQVARSRSIEGPYQVYSNDPRKKTDGIWVSAEQGGFNDPKIIVYPLIKNAYPNAYGAGQQSIIVKDNTLYMLYTDDSYANTQASPQPLYLLSSDNPVKWTPSQTAVTNLGWRNTNDFAWDPVVKKFIMYSLTGSHSATPFVEKGFSDDGKKWENWTTIVPSTSWPPYTHNSGFTRDQRGFALSEERTMFGFGAPYDLVNDISWGQWDLYATFLNNSDSVPVPIKASPTTKK